MFSPVRGARRRRRVGGTLVAVGLATLGVAACGSSASSSTASSSAASSPAASTSAAASSASSGSALSGKGLKLAFVARSQGGTSYFVNEGKGFSAEAAKLGATASVQFTQSASDQLTAVSTAISSGAKGLAVVIQTPALGSAVARSAANGHVALVGADDVFNNQNGQPVPYVNVDSRQAGKTLGQEMATLYNASGWSKQQNVGLLSIDLDTIASCHERTTNALSTFEGAVPGFPHAHVVHVTYDGTLSGGKSVVSAIVNKYSQYKNWLVWSCNDEGVVGGIKALEAANYTVPHIIGVGVGGELDCDEWASGGPSAFRAAVAFSPQKNGEAEAMLLVRYLTQHVAIPATYAPSFKVVTAADYKSVPTC